jgi:hypothetical protein
LSERKIYVSVLDFVFGLPYNAKDMAQAHGPKSWESDTSLLSVAEEAVGERTDSGDFKSANKTAKFTLNVELEKQIWYENKN